MPIAIEGWKKPTIGPGLEAFEAGDVKAQLIAAGGPGGDVGLGSSIGVPSRLGLQDTPPAIAPRPVSDADLLQLIKALTGILAKLTDLVGLALGGPGKGGPSGRQQ